MIAGITIQRPIVLVGMMGAGKSSIGRRLAPALGLDFRDINSEIEAAAGCSVAEIFERYGEAEFRNGERKIIARLLTETPRVLAAGGGAFMDMETRAAIKQQGISIWLKAPLDLLIERALRKDNRPLLKTGNPRQTMERLLAEREPVYADADITVASDDGPHEVVVKRIVAALDDFSSAKP